MGESERAYEFYEEPDIMTSDQVEFVRARAYNIIAAQSSGFGIGGSGHNLIDLEWSHLILSDLLSDLKSSQAVLSFENPDGSLVYENLPEHALTPLSAIMAAPNLSRHHKTQLITEYPHILYGYKFTMTLHGARSKVSQKLREAKFISPFDLDQHRQIVMDVEQRWRRETKLKVMRLLGFIVEE